jgi:hypothetical protein
MRYKKQILTKKQERKIRRKKKRLKQKTRKSLRSWKRRK